MNENSESILPQEKGRILFGFRNDYAASLFQALGPRSEQQDNLWIFNIEKPLTEGDLRELFTTMAEATADFGPGMGGSTVNLAAISGGHIIAGNLGDSMTTLFTRKAAGENLQAEMLSTIHNPHNKNEAKRLKPLIEPFNLYIDNGYICKFEGSRTYGVQMSRSLGNASLAPMVIQEPSIHTYVLDTSAYNFAQLALYTDGVTGTRQHPYAELDYNADHLAALMEEPMNRLQGMEKTAACALGLHTLESGICDNATALSIDLKTLPAEQSILAAVFDGHGPKGEEVTQVAIAALQNIPALQ